MSSPCWGRGTLRAAGPGQGHPQRDPQRLALLRYTEPSEISKQIFCEKIFAKLKTKKLLSKKIEIISTPLPPPPAMTVCLSSYRPPTRPQPPPKPLSRTQSNPEPAPTVAFCKTIFPETSPQSRGAGKSVGSPPRKNPAGLFDPRREGLTS
jgi:hypothetical protein